MLRRHSGGFCSFGAGKSPEDSSLVRHPWELTLREFIEVVRRNYGIEIDYSSAAITASRFLRKDGRAFVILIEEDEILSISLLRSLCRFYSIPPEDFGLHPETEED
ncbi:MAG TPA: hypothetical protein VLX28_00645 [Thermoanaerobaculia bacterium]|nr:hypothetical protein [Thermoanaerobaculia bacterium]